MPAMFGERLVAACGSWHAKLDRTLHAEVFRRQEATRRELDHYKTKLEPMRLEKEKRDLTRLKEQKKLGKAAARTLGMAQGSKRERHSQLQRLISRPFSTRFG